MIVEQYLPSAAGADQRPFADYVSVETLGTPTGLRHVAVTGRLHPVAPFRETGFFVPAALGVTSGCVHTEIKLTPAGPRVIEVNGRLGGGIRDIVSAAAGVDLLALYLRCALGQPVDLGGPAATHAVGYRLFYQPPVSARRVRSIGGLKEVGSLPGVDEVSLHLSPGDPIDAAQGSRSYVFAVVGTADDPAGVAEVNRRMYELADVTYDHGTDDRNPNNALARASPLSRIRRANPVDGWDQPLEIALVNTMPDAAFEETERQFTRLLRAGADGRRHAISLYSIPDRTRSGVIRQVLDDRYQGLGALYRRPPDAVVVTGSEPRQFDLRDEVTWVSLSGLLRWARGATSSVLLSCLAAHASLLAVEGVERVRLPAKHSGIYPQAAHRTHPLAAGLDSVTFPHSRLHDVPTPVVEEHGYTVLLQSEEVGWTMAAAEGECLVVLLQGHPEYAPDTLLREYRRDVRRYLTGGLRGYPRIPAGYLDPGGVRLLQRFKDQARAVGRAATLLETFPFKACVDRIAVDWQWPMEQLAGNWFTEVQRRTLAKTRRRAG